MYSLCRLCAKYTTATELITEILELEPKLSLCCGWTSLENEEKMPQKACNLCVEKLGQSWAFAESIWEAEKQLKKLASELISEDCVEPHVEEIIAEPIQHKIEDTTDSENLLKTLNDNVEYNDMFDNTFVNSDAKNTQSNACTNRKVEKTKEQCAEVKNIGKHARFLAALNVEDRLADGRISAKAIARLETLFPEMKAMAWNQCQYMCKKCNVKCKSPQNFFAHNRSFHLKELTTMDIFCSYCDFSHISENELNRHIAVHFPHLKFSCFYCTDYFWDVHELVKHRSMHTDVEYKCGICEQMFSSRCAFKRHINKVHLKTKTLHFNPSKQFTCEICDKNFPTQWKIKNHMELHAKKYKFVCEQCGWKFHSNGNLKCHLATHSNERPFACTQCDKRFKTKPSLNKHSVLHNGVRPSCSECGKRFHDKYKLKEHMIVHTDVFPFSCEFCDKKFQFKKRLMVHRRVHTNEKPYACGLCEYKCAGSGNMSNHKKRVHCKDSNR